MAPISPPTISAEISSLTEMFKSNGNRALAWHIFSLCRKADHAIPDIIMEEIDRFAAGVSEVAQTALDTQPGDDVLRFKPADLGRLWRGGADAALKDPVGMLQTEARNSRAYEEIMHRVDNGQTVASAIADLAKQKWQGLGKDNLWLIWRAINQPPSST